MNFLVALDIARQLSNIALFFVLWTYILIVPRCIWFRQNPRRKWCKYGIMLSCFLAQAGVAASLVAPYTLAFPSYLQWWVNLRSVGLTLVIITPLCMFWPMLKPIIFHKPVKE